MKSRAVIFDLDGTLLDTLDDLADSVNAVLSRRSLPTHPTDSYRMFVGEGARVLVQRALGAGIEQNELIDSVLEEYRDEYATRWNSRTRPYPGIQQMLERLATHDVPAAVLSNKPDYFTKKCVAEYFSGVRFAAVAGQVDGVPCKPDPAGALRIADLLGLTANEVLYVGDSSVDMKTASSAGMLPTGVLWGFRSRDELLQSGAEKLVSHPDEIAALLL